MNRNFDAAVRTIDRALKIDPKAFPLWELKAKFAIEQKGDFSVSGERHLDVLGAMPHEADEAKPGLPARGPTSLFWNANMKEGLGAAENISDNAIMTYSGACSLVSQILIDRRFTRKALQDEAGARTAFLKAKEFAETQLKQDPRNASRHVELAQVLAWLGEKEAALAEAKRATELLPESKDAFEGPRITGAVPIVYCIVGDTDRAIELLDGLLARPSVTSVPMLKTQSNLGSVAARLTLPGLDCTNMARLRRNISRRSACVIRQRIDWP